MRAMSSWYLRSTPSVSVTVAGSSATASSSVSARRPVERLGDARRLEQVLLAQRLDEMRRPPATAACAMPGTLARTIASSRSAFGIADPVIEAAPLQRVVDFAGAVRGDDHDRRMRRLDGAELGDRHLEIGQHLEQEGLERLVGAVELVDQQHRRAGRVGLERLQQRPLDQKTFREDVVRRAARGRRSPSASASRIAIICAA